MIESPVDTVVDGDKADDLISKRGITPFSLYTMLWRRALNATTCAPPCAKGRSYLWSDKAPGSLGKAERQ